MWHVSLMLRFFPRGYPIQSRGPGSFDLGWTVCSKVKIGETNLGIALGVTEPSKSIRESRCAGAFPLRSGVVVSAPCSTSHCKHLASARGSRLAAGPDLLTGTSGKSFISTVHKCPKWEACSPPQNGSCLQFVQPKVYGASPTDSLLTSKFMSMMKLHN